MNTKYPPPCNGRRLTDRTYRSILTKHCVSQFVLIAAFLTPLVTVHAALKSWTGTAGDFLWTNPANWSPAGVPAPADNVTFTNEGVADIPLELGGFVNVDLNANSPQVINSLGFRTRDGAHNISLTSPLIVAGTSAEDVAFVADDGQPAALFVGTGGQDGPSDVVHTTILGDSLVLSNRNANLSVMQGSASSGTHWATLDLSALNRFTCVVSNLLVAHDFGQLVMRPNGTLILAVSNVITANLISLSDAYQNAGSSGDGSRIFLGQDNTVNVDRIRIALHKCVATFSFKEGLATPSVVFRNAAGTGRQISWEIGDEYEPDTTLGYYTSNQAIGTMDLTSGRVDALVDRIVLGRGQTNNPTRTGDGNGTLTFGAGTIDVNTLEVGVQLTGGASAGRGTINVNMDDAVNPAVLRVNSNLFMAVQLEGNTEATGSTALINLNGGRLDVAGDVTDGGGSSTINISNGGMLDLMPEGDSTPGNISVDVLTLADGSITDYATLSVSNLVISGATTLFTVNNGQTIAPLGIGTIGTMNVDGSLELKGTTDIDVSKTGSALTSDQIVATGSINLGGTLKVRISGNSALAAGDKFILFPTAIPANSFASLDFASPGPGLAWTNKIAADGSIEVIVSNQPTPPVLTLTRAAGNITLSWPATSLGFTLQEQINPLTGGIGLNWSSVPGVSGNEVILPLDPANGTVFFRLIKP